MAITQEELEKRIKALANRAGWNPQGSATTGLRRRNVLNIEDLDPRDINPGLGLHRQMPDESQNFSEMPEEAAPQKREPGTDVAALGSVGDAPAPTGQGVGIGPIAGLAKGAAIPALGNIALGLSNPVFGKVALAKLVYDSIQKSRNPDVTMTEDEAFKDIEMDFMEEEDPVQFSEFSTDIGLDPDVNPEAFSEFSTEDLGESAGGIGGGNVGGSGTPGGFGGPMSGGGQEGDAGGSNTGTVGEGEGDGK